MKPQSISFKSINERLCALRTNATVSKVWVTNTHAPIEDKHRAIK